MLGLKFLSTVPVFCCDGLQYALVSLAGAGLKVEPAGIHRACSLLKLQQLVAKVEPCSVVVLLQYVFNDLTMTTTMPKPETP